MVLSRPSTRPLGHVTAGSQPFTMTMPLTASPRAARSESRIFGCTWQKLGSTCKGRNQVRAPARRGVRAALPQLGEEFARLARRLGANTPDLEREAEHCGHVVARARFGVGDDVRVPAAVAAAAAKIEKRCVVKRVERRPFRTRFDAGFQHNLAWFQTQFDTGFELNLTSVSKWI